MSLVRLDSPTSIALALATVAAHASTQTHLGGNVLDVLAALLLEKWVARAVLEHLPGKLNSSLDCGASVSSEQPFLLGQVSKNAEEFVHNAFVRGLVACQVGVDLRNPTHA